MPPTTKQINYLGHLLGTTRTYRIEEYVGRIVGKSRTKVRPQPLTRSDYSAAIDAARSSR